MFPSEALSGFAYTKFKGKNDLVEFFGCSVIADKYVLPVGKHDTLSGMAHNVGREVGGSWIRLCIIRAIFATALYLGERNNPYLLCAVWRYIRGSMDFSDLERILKRRPGCCETTESDRGIPHSHRGSCGVRVRSYVGIPPLRGLMSKIRKMLKRCTSEEDEDTLFDGLREVLGVLTGC